MAAPRTLAIDVGKLRRDEEMGKLVDSPHEKKSKLRDFPLSPPELLVFVCLLFVFSIGLYLIYSTMPSTEYGRIKFPRTISDLRLLKYVQIHLCQHLFFLSLMSLRISKLEWKQGWIPLVSLISLGILIRSWDNFKKLTVEIASRTGTVWYELRKEWFLPETGICSVRCV